MSRALARAAMDLATQEQIDVVLVTMIGRMDPDFLARCAAYSAFLAANDE